MMTNDLPSPVPSAPRAYSYLRFSTPEQMRGDSFRRQTELADTYAAKHGLLLDDKLRLHDLGKSAFHGQNAVEGKLGIFIEHVRSGEVPQGSVLLVESLDRLSRQEVATAQLSFLNLLNSGVRVVTLLDGQEYSWESANGSGGVQLIISLLLMSRAHEESATKSQRNKASWENKRAQAGVKPLTARAPAWLVLRADRSAFEVIQERAALVGRIFALTLQGVGQHSIASTFNEEGIRPWGRGKFWHRSYVKKVLENPAVIGTFQPHLSEYEGGKKFRTPLEPLEGYFPAIIPEETFREAQALQQAHGAAQRGRHAHGPVTNLLAGLAVCGSCGSTMTRVNKGKRSRPSYVCSKAKAGAGCAYRSVRCDLVEAALLRQLPGLLEDLEGAAEGDDLDMAQMRGAEELVDELREEAASTAETLVILRGMSGQGRFLTLARKLRKQEAELAEAEEALRSLQERQVALTGLTIAARVERALATLREPPETRTPLSINLALRLVFERAVFLATERNKPDASDWRWWAIELEWKHGGSCLIPLVSFKPWIEPDNKEKSDG